MPTRPTCSEPEAPATGGAGVHRISLPTPFPVGWVNSYLIEDDPLTLLDAGPNSATTLTALEAELAALGHRIEEIGLILVTHQHLDHIGLVDIVARRSGAEVAALDRLVPWLAVYDESMAAQQSYADEIMAAHGVPREVRLAVQGVAGRLQGWGGPVTVTVPLAPGAELRLRDRTLRAFHRPGHSPSDTVFVDAERSTMFGGDHLLGHISSNPVLTRPLVGDGHPRPQTLVTYLDSLRATQADAVEVILPGHGDPIYDHAALIQRRITDHEERRDRLHTLIRERSRTAHELAVALWEDVAVSQAFLTLSEVLGHVDLLINDGHVVEVEGPHGRIRFRAR
jgi:glyoxylase-like metal-dependent hydrolase (beta-lactamase superfamily II)